MARTFLGIPITRSTETDSDWVALVRSEVSSQSRSRWFSFIFALTCIVSGLGFPMLFIRLVESRTASPFTDAGFAGGFAAGFVFFSLSGFLVLVGVVEFGLAVSSFKGCRTEKLLLKYYDKCQKAGQALSHTCPDDEAARLGQTGQNTASGDRTPTHASWTRISKHFRNAMITIVVLGLLAAFLSMTWRATAWKQAAFSKADRIGNLMAAGDYAKGKRVQYRLLVVRDLDEWPQPKPTEWDGPYVVRDWICFTYPPFPFSLCCPDRIYMSGGTNSPDVQLARKSVESYNRRMRDICENPERHRKLILKHLHYWETNVLGKTEVSTNTVQEYFRRASGGIPENEPH